MSGTLTLSTEYRIVYKLESRKQVTIETLPLGITNSEAQVRLNVLWKNHRDDCKFGRVESRYISAWATRMSTAENDREEKG